MRKERGIALLPIGVFLVLYLGLGILFEYVMKIPMGFYNVPIVVAFLVAILVACLQNRELNFDKKLESDSCQIFRGGFICGCLFRVRGNGNICGNHYASGSYCISRLHSFWIQSCILCGICDGRCHVRR